MPLSSDFPLYNRGPRLYNVSLAFPGPKLYDMPVGPLAKDMGYDNTNTSLIFPDIEFIRKFASYDLGISDSMLRSSFNSNSARIKSSARKNNVNEEDVQKQFQQIFESSSQDDMGFKGIEKAILSSIFETQKPYFEIVQSITSIVSDVEDVIARICPLFGAAIVGPAAALSVKSRKPVGKGNDTGFGPAAIGFGGGTVLKNKIREFKIISQKGNSVSVSKDGVATITEPILRKPSDIGENLNYSYVTVSTVYSTGQFSPFVNYTYKYIDLDSTQIFPQIPEEVDDIDEDLIKPERIILGMYDTDGNSINPTNKIEYWNVNSNGTLEKEFSIFEKAPWIYKSDKWIFPKENLEFGNGQKFCWDLVSGGSDILWVNRNVLRIGGKILSLGGLIWSPTNPNNDVYETVKYGELPGFDKNGPYGFRKDEIVTYIGQVVVDRTIDYYNDYTKSELERSKVDPDNQEIVRGLIRELYRPKNGNVNIGGREVPNEDPVRESIKNISSFGKLKLSLYEKSCEEEDWGIYSDTSPTEDINIWGPTSENPAASMWTTPPNTGYKPNIRKSYAPMKFNIEGRGVWIDPEIDYDLKIIRVDSTNRVSYKETATGLPDVVLDSYIQEFVKNAFQIKVVDSVDGVGKSEKLFSYNITKNGVPFANGDVVDQYSLTNWDFEFNSGSQSFTRTNENIFDVEIFLESGNPPDYITSVLLTDLPRVSLGTFSSDNVFSKPRPEYEFIDDSPIKSTWKKISENRESTEETIPDKLTKIGDSYFFTDLRVIYNTDTILSPTDEVEYDRLVLEGRVDEANEFVATRSVIFKWYDVEATQKSGIFSIQPSPTRRFRNIDIVVDNGQVQKWVIFKNSLSDNTQFKGMNIMPRFFKKNIVTLDLTSEFSNDDTSADLDTIETIDIGKYNAKLSDDGNPIIDSSNILNDALVKDELYSKGRYGYGDPDDPIKFGYIRRSQVTELDVESYYIVEGIKTKSNKTDKRTPSQEDGVGSGGFYRLPHALGIVPVMVRMLVKIGSKIIPNIKRLISLIKNPSSFISEIIKMKMSDSFTIFNSRSIDDLIEIDQISKEVKSTMDPNLKKRVIKRAKDKLNESELKNHIFFGDDGNFKFLIDGTGLIEFFGILFGLKLDITNSFNSIPIKPVFENQRQDLDYLIDKFNSDTKYNLPDFIGIDSDRKPLSDIITNGGKYGVPLKSDSSYEIVSIVYSTGEFIKGIDYKYIYVDQAISSLIDEGDRLSNESLEKTDIAIEKYNEAYNLAEKTDNLSLKNEILEKIKSLKTKSNILSQPIIKFLLGIVTLPIKIIYEVVKWLLEFFLSLTNPPEIPTKMKEFLSFDWIIKFFTPKFIFDLVGIKFNPSKLSEWAEKSKIKNPLFGKSSGQAEYLYDDFPLADMNLFFSIPFESKLPTYTGKQFREIISHGLRISTPFFCLFERIINGFIMLIWSIMGISAIIPPPLIKICSKLNENIDIEDLQKLISGLYDGSDDDGAYGYKTSDNIESSFVYDVKMPDGSIRKDLNREQIEKIISENKDFDFNFSNFESL